MERRKLTKEDIDKVRDIEGFPIGKDEDIIALSDAPYYTACPNPFIKEFIEENGTPYDEETDDYHREPFASDVSEGKGDVLYNIHTYHTKVPPKAILKYITHYTMPGDIVYDAFAGSGMTGVACTLANSEEAEINAGHRYCILNDVSVAASFIEHGYNYSGDVVSAMEYADEMLSKARDIIGWAYKTKHSAVEKESRQYGEINYTVWSDVLICPNCGHELVYYNVGIDKESGHKKGKNIVCPKCSYEGNTSTYSKSIEQVLDDVTGDVKSVAKEVPVLINYTFAGHKYEKKPDEYDMEVIKNINDEKILTPYPTNIIPDGFNTSQPKKSHYVERMDLFYNKRALMAFSLLWDMADKAPQEYKNIIKFWLQTVSVGFTKTNRYFSSSYSQVNRYLKGTLYIAATRSEVSPWYALKGKINKIKKVPRNKNCIISCMSSEKSLIPDNSVDYIFIDPPFGSNIMYSDLNIIWESWLKVFTQTSNEAIINSVADKDDVFYTKLMGNVLCDCYRVLKPGRWITIEFHNSQNYVWNILQNVVNRAGFVIADVRVLDKQVLTMKQFSTDNAVDKDLVISAYKPKNKFIKNFEEKAGTKEEVWAFVNQHLQNLPIAPDGDNNGKIDIMPERQNYLLYDRMVAWHIMHGIAVPLDAQEFYAGLDEHFLKRDDMYFLPEQVTEYDQKRAVMGIETTELAFLAITDEKNAIQWLNYQLQTPQSYAELQPLYLQELHQDKNEAIPELLDLLKENFLLNEDTGKWYIPDITKAGDIAKLREKSLMKEFEGYLSGKGKLKVFRSEAIRLGVGKLWKEKNYKGIVDICKRLPEKTIQEDQSILMYYDNSLMRI